jgi:hypothetical protein
MTILRHPVFLALLLAICGGWVLSGVLLFMLAMIGAPDVAAANLPTYANSLVIWCWFDGAVRAWAVVAAAWWLARQGLSFPWSRATMLGWGAGWALLFEVTFFPHGATAAITPLLVWATIPLAWLGVLLASPLAEGANSAQTLVSQEAEDGDTM